MNGLYGLLAMVVYVVAILGVVMVRDQGLAWRFEQELGTAERERQSLLEVLEARLGPAGAPLVKRLQLDNPARRENVRQRIDAAGRPGGLTSSATRGARAPSSSSAIGLALFVLLLGELAVGAGAALPRRLRLRRVAARHGPAPPGGRSSAASPTSWTSSRCA